MALALSNNLRNLRRRVNRVRRFPANTCPASRHLHIMADELLAGRTYAMFAEEPEHCAETMLLVLESLWKLRTRQPRTMTDDRDSSVIRTSRSTGRAAGGDLSYSDPDRQEQQ